MEMIVLEKVDVTYIADIDLFGLRSYCPFLGLFFTPNHRIHILTWAEERCGFVILWWRRKMTPTLERRYFQFSISHKVEGCKIPWSPLIFMPHNLNIDG